MTLQHSITINGVSHDIDQDVDIRALMDRIESAVRSGGRFVSVELVRGRLLDVLIAPGLSVNIEAQSSRALEVVPVIGETSPSVFDEFDEFDDL